MTGTLATRHRAMRDDAGERAEAGPLEHAGRAPLHKLLQYSSFLLKIVWVTFLCHLNGGMQASFCFMYPFAERSIFPLWSPAMSKSSTCFPSDFCRKGGNCSQRARFYKLVFFQSRESPWQCGIHFIPSYSATLSVFLLADDLFCIGWLQIIF